MPLSLLSNSPRKSLDASCGMTNPTQPDKPETEKREPLDFPGFDPNDEDPVGDDSKIEPGTKTADEPDGPPDPTRAPEEP